ncbi:MAG: hypothetical protein AAFY65_10980 [Pseudomonadota bacterium]
MADVIKLDDRRPVCLSCEGSGNFIECDEDGDEVYDKDFMPVLVPCSACDGTGIRQPVPPARLKEEHRHG